jgi:hypothetical protein
MEDFAEFYQAWTSGDLASLIHGEDPGIMAGKREGWLLDFIAARDEGGAMALLAAHPELLDSKTPYQGLPLLCLAAEGGLLRLAAALLDRGAPVSARDHGHIFGPGKTPLLWAAEAGQVDAVAFLLRRGAGVDEAGGARIIEAPHALDAGWPESRLKAAFFGGKDGCVLEAGPGGLGGCCGLRRSRSHVAPAPLAGLQRAKSRATRAHSFASGAGTTPAGRR